MLDSEVMETIKKNFEMRIGISYDVFSILPIEEQQRLEDSLDDIIYSKPVAFVRKIGRRINRHIRK